MHECNRPHWSEHVTVTERSHPMRPRIVSMSPCRCHVPRCGQRQDAPTCYAVERMPTPAYKDPSAFDRWIPLSDAESCCGSSHLSCATMPCYALLCLAMAC